MKILLVGAHPKQMPKLEMWAAALDLYRPGRIVLSIETAKTRGKDTGSYNQTFLRHALAQADKVIALGETAARAIGTQAEFYKLPHPRRGQLTETARAELEAFLEEGVAP